MTKILTFGSCLSLYTAKAYIHTYGGELLGSVFHNRIDRFTGIYVTKTQSETPRSSWSNLAIDPEGRKIIENQYLDGTLGKHKLPKEINGFLHELENEKIDIIFMDNYVDLCGKLLIPKKGGEGLFFNAKTAENTSEIFDLEEDFLDLEFAAECWHTFIKFVREKQPEARLVFLHFPFNHHRNNEVAQRSKEFQKYFDPKINVKKPRICDIVPNIEVPQKYLKKHTQSHFAREFYFMLSGLVNYRYNYTYRVDAKELGF
jgi:hypothetical protein